MMPLISLFIIGYALFGGITTILCYGMCNNPEVRRFIIDKPPICLLIWPIFMIFIITFLIKFWFLYIVKSIKEILFITKELFKSK